MKKIIILTCILCIAILGYFSIPFTTSETNDFYQPFTRSPQASAALQKTLNEEMKKGEADAVVMLEGDKLLAEWGETDTISNVASVRKSLISALFGIAEDKQLVNLQQTLGELRINDTVNPLTETEKSATIEDLLKARSGVYLPSIGESQQMKELRPKRGSYQPNEHYYYNNWDFNVLGVIFEQETGLSIGEAFYEWIAKPTHMKQFRPENVVYNTAEDTSIPMYRFYMCAEDLARFGALYANDGVWNGKQIIPKTWIDKSFTAYSTIEDVDQFTGYGYLWWLEDNNKLQWAVGAGGQFIIVDRANKLVVAMMNNTGTTPLQVFLYRQFSKEETYAKARSIHHLAKKEIGK
ncbi:beta-lactamase family protein [Ectobacillus sp. JY-23]|uniref:serine hydrolase domain-containing protein n=1 Tax=Ectobacillus sp. JY-23 TaxID=2933872 RepID=UPI001FF2699F|nr:serine hydrolase [Ectobacillus sp. JY-23]UOY92420.1 beta-lactamase family protein [Ectobacillus sp. JY-23]